MPFLKKIKPVARSRELKRLTDKNGLSHAVFTLAKEKYIGEWKDNVRSGKGSLKSKNNTLYEGDFKDNKRHGFGVLAKQLKCKVYKMTYLGEWKHGKASGSGVCVYKTGDFYIGSFENGKYHGLGTMYYRDGSFYHGNWYNGYRKGEGLWIRPDGNRYEGEWDYDQKHGKGKFYHLDSGQLQKGVWIRGICVFSIIIDIPFRQAAVSPTVYALQKTKLNNPNFIEEQEKKALNEEEMSCLDQLPFALDKWSLNSAFS